MGILGVRKPFSLGIMVSTCHQNLKRMLTEFIVYKSDIWNVPVHKQWMSMLPTSYVAKFLYFQKYQYIVLLKKLIVMWQ